MSQFSFNPFLSSFSSFQVVLRSRHLIPFFFAFPNVVWRLFFLSLSKPSQAKSFLFFFLQATPSAVSALNEFSSSLPPSVGADEQPSFPPTPPTFSLGYFFQFLCPTISLTGFLPKN
jgi:hypothetical protein